MSKAICPHCNFGELSYSGEHDSATGSLEYRCVECDYSMWFKRSELEAYLAMDRTIYYIIKTWDDPYPLGIKPERPIWIGSILTIGNCDTRVTDIDPYTNRIMITGDLGKVKFQYL